MVWKTALQLVLNRFLVLRCGFKFMLRPAVLGPHRRTNRFLKHDTLALGTQCRNNDLPLFSMAFPYVPSLVGQMTIFSHFRD